MLWWWTRSSWQQPAGLWHCDSGPLFKAFNNSGGWSRILCEQMNDGSHATQAKVEWFTPLGGERTQDPRSRATKLAFARRASYVWPFTKRALLMWDEVSVPCISMSYPPTTSGCSIAPPLSKDWWTNPCTRANNYNPLPCSIPCQHEHLGMLMLLCCIRV